MTQRDTDYQTLATAINTLLYSQGYKEFFNTSDMEDGIVLSANRKKLEAIYAEIENISPSSENPIKVRHILPRGHYKHSQNGINGSLPDLTVALKEAEGTNPICIQLTLGQHYRKKALNNYVEAIDRKSGKNMVETYFGPIIEASEHAFHIVSGLVNPRYAEGLVNKWQEELDRQSKQLQVLKAELALKQNPHGIGWGDRVVSGGKQTMVRA